MLCIKVMETVSTEKIFVVSAFADVILMYSIWLVLSGCSKRHHLFYVPCLLIFTCFLLFCQSIALLVETQLLWFYLQPKINFWRRV